MFQGPDSQKAYFLAPQGEIPAVTDAPRQSAVGIVFVRAICGQTVETAPVVSDNSAQIGFDSRLPPVSVPPGSFVSPGKPKKCPRPFEFSCPVRGT